MQHIRALTLYLMVLIPFPIMCGENLPTPMIIHISKYELTAVCKPRLLKQGGIQWYIDLERKGIPYRGATFISGDTLITLPLSKSDNDAYNYIVGDLVDVDDLFYSYVDKARAYTSDTNLATYLLLHANRYSPVTVEITNKQAVYDGSDVNDNIIELVYNCQKTRRGIDANAKYLERISILN